MRARQSACNRQHMLMTGERRSYARPQDGFTLIELLVAFIVIGVLIAVAAPSFLGQTGKSKDSAASQNLGVAYRQAKGFAVEHAGTFTPPPDIPGAPLDGLVDSLQRSEPQTEVGRILVRSDAELAWAAMVPGRMYVVSGSADGESADGSLKVAVRSESGRICVMTSSARAGPDIRCDLVTNTSGTVRSFAEVMQASMPWSWWRFNDTGATAADEQGVASGTYVGSPQRVPGVLPNDRSGAMKFDGVSDYITLPVEPLGTPPTFSVEAWIKQDHRELYGPDGEHAMIFQLAWDTVSDDGIAFSALRNRVQLYAGPGGHEVSDPTTKVGRTVQSGTILPNQVNHVAATYNGLTGVMQAYLNGYLVHERRFIVPQSITWHARRTALIGKQEKPRHQQYRYFNGVLDELAYYQRVLTADEVLDHYRAGMGMPTPY
jgi:prepilin-type N-terminal cleavage/methylation domain-containing protein